MPDRRRVLRAALLAAAGLALPQACGVPSRGSAIVDGWGPSSGLGNTENRTAPGPDDAVRADDLVLKFLVAISGKLDAESRKNAADQAKKFLTGDAAASWQPDDQQITVVRTTTPVVGVGGGQAGSFVVSLSMQPVGMLTERGEVQSLQQGTSGAWIPMQFTVTPNTGSSSTAKLLIEQLPPHLPATLLLDARALDPSSGDAYYFQPQLIYFWDTARHELIPDLRYLPLVALSQTAQLTQLVNWVLAGPSDWLKAAATSAVPSGTTLIGPYVVPDKDNRLQVNFSAGLQGADLNSVMAQLRWSLSGLWTNAVQLQIASQPQRVDGSSDEYLAANLASRPHRDASGEQFCVVDGVVRPVNNPATTPPVLNAPDINKGVSAAALSRDKTMAALVRGNSLVIGKAGATPADPPTYQTAKLNGKTWSRPAFLPDRPTDPARVLIAVDGQLYLVDPDMSAASITPSWANGVTAFAVSPDGHRIALLDASRAAWVAPLLDDGDTLTVAAPRAISVGGLDTHGIAWTRLDRVLVSGRDGQAWKLYEVSVDGTLITPWGTNFTSEIDKVVAYPPVPSRTSGSGPAMVELKDGETHNVYTNSEGPLQLTGTPLPSPSAGTPPANQPRAPFYLD